MDPLGNQIHLTYQRDLETFSSVQYVRSAELATIEYDSPTCQNTTTACTTGGTTPNKWAPLMRANFVASHTPSRLTNTPSGCNTSSNARCDDPKDLSGSGGLAAPQVMSTFALNDLQVQVRSSGTASWNTLQDYQFSYEQSGPSTITDPATGKQESVSGMFDLTQFKEVGDDGSTSLPARVFSYTSVDQSYVDSGYSPASGVGCGFSWNTGNGSGCLLWSRTVAGNNRYLSSASNGMGLAQTFSWDNARNNMHGVVGGGANTSNPLYCNDASRQSTYPCDEADDETWSRVILTQDTEQVLRLTQNGQGGTQTSTPVTGTTSYTYTLAYPLVAQECSDCVAGMYWGNQNEGDYLDYYNGKFMGFTQTKVTHPDGSVDIHKYEVTEGWGIYDTAQTACKSGSPCHNAPWWHIGNAGHGHEIEVDNYDIGGTTLLSQTTTSYNLVCPPSGVSASPPAGFGNWDNNRVSELDHGNPVAVCDVQTSQIDTYTWDGASNGTAVPHSTVTFTYDSFGRVISKTTTSNDGGATGSPTTIVQKLDYIWNNAVTTTLTSAQGTYLISFPALVRTEDSGGTTRSSCVYSSYDGAINLQGQQSSLIKGLLTTSDTYTSCGTSPNFTPSGQLSTSYSYDTYGNQRTTNDPDANAGDSTHRGCTAGSNTYSACETYDATFSVLPVSGANALNQTTTIGYNPTTDATGGFGLWPTSATDPNSQVAKIGYDPLGRTLSMTMPGETAGLTTSSTSYTVWCSGTAAQSPCVEIDSTQRLDSTHTVTSRQFYDGLGRLVETRDPAAGGHDTVQYAYYDPSGKQVFLSIPYLVTAYTGAPGAAAYSIPDSSQPGTSLSYTSLLSATTSDPLSHSSTSTDSIVCNASGTGDTACYVQTADVDALSHKSTTLTDALGRTVYTQTFTGNSSATYAVYATIKNKYDLNGNLTKVTQPNGSATTYTYDAANRKTGMTDPDLGTWTYTYDANGNLRSSVDPRGTAGSPVTLVGDTTVESNTDTNDAGIAQAFIYTASTSGTANTLSIYLDSANAAGTVLVGLYADNGNVSNPNPSTLLAQASITSPQGGAWNTVSLAPTVALTAGQKYWIAVLAPAGDGQPFFRDQGSGGLSVGSASNTLSTLPATWVNGATWSSTSMSAYVSQASSSAGTIYANYDGLNRQLWRNTSDTSSGAYVSYSYDSTASGNKGIGRLTGESFTGGDSSHPLHGSYSYTYDGRGQTTGLTLTTTENTTYPLTYAYNDAGQVTSLTFSDGEVFSPQFDSASGWLTSAVTTPSGCSQVNLLTNVTYSGTGGAAGFITGGSMANGTYNLTASYDNNLRLSSMALTNAGTGTTLLSTSRSYDAVGNVTAVNTTLATGTDNQRFCYDEQDRLVWAGSTGTPSCGGTLTAGTLTAANYTATYSYDNLNRITGGALGTLTYGDSAHLHAATASSNGETTSYDAAGNMICRAPSSSTTCTGSSPTGATMAYDAEGRLNSWQNAPTNPTSQAWFMYDGEGRRVEQLTSGGSGNHTYYLPGNVEEVTPSGGLVKYYTADGLLIGENTASTASGIYYLASDGLGSVTETLNGSGTVTGSILYGPYGGIRYSSGTMPTAKGFTGQYADASTGLDYYGARYYDPALGQFTSADPVDDGFNRYIYVHGNPETDVDPTGNTDVDGSWAQFVQWFRQASFNVLTGLQIIIGILVNIPPPTDSGPIDGPTITNPSHTATYNPNDTAALQGGEDSKGTSALGNRSGKPGKTKSGSATQARNTPVRRNTSREGQTKVHKGANRSKGNFKQTNATVSAAGGTAGMAVHTTHSAGAASTSNWWDGITSTARNIGTGIVNFGASVYTAVSSVHISAGPVTLYGVAAVAVVAIAIFVFAPVLVFA